MTKLSGLFLVFLLSAPLWANQERVWNKNPFTQGRTEAKKTETENESQEGTGSIPRALRGETLPILNGIWKTGGRYRAMIDSDIVSSGDELEGFYIQNIRTGSIILRSKASGSLVRIDFEDEVSE